VSEPLATSAVPHLLPPPRAHFKLVQRADSPDKGDLTVKASGKQTIFVYNQANLSAVSPEEMAELEEELKQTKEQLAESTKELKSIHAGASSTSIQGDSLKPAISANLVLPRTKDLQAEIARVQEEVRR